MGEERGRRTLSECLDEEVTFAYEREDYVMVKEVESKYGKTLFQEVMGGKKLYDICFEGRLSVLKQLFTEYPILVNQLNRPCSGGDYLLHRAVCGKVDDDRYDFHTWAPCHCFNMILIFIASFDWCNS